MNQLTAQGGSGALSIRQTIGQEQYERFISFLDASPKTIETYRRALRQLFIHLASKGIAQPSREDILSYREDLKQSHRPATVQAYIIAARLFFAWTAQEGIYPNVAEKVKGAKIDREHKKGYLTSTQVKAILGNIDRSTITGKRDYAIMALMITGGLRTIEVSRADAEDMQTVGDSAALFLQGKGKEEKAQYVKLPAPVEQAIREYLKEAPAAGNVPLFRSGSNNSQGERLSTRSISGITKTHMKAAGYDSDRLTAHSLRHTAATLNLLNGGSLEETQQLLRHKDINTTMIYTHALERANNQSESRIASAIF